MNESEVHSELDMLRGNLCRICVSDDPKEVFQMYEYAKKRLDRIYEYHISRLNNA